MRGEWVWWVVRVNGIGEYGHGVEEWWENRYGGYDDMGKLGSEEKWEKWVSDLVHGWHGWWGYSMRNGLVGY